MTALREPPSPPAAPGAPAPLPPGPRLPRIVQTGYRETGQPPRRPVVAAAAPEFDTLEHDDHTPPGGLPAVPEVPEVPAAPPATLLDEEDTPTADLDMAALAGADPTGLGTPGDTPTATLKGVGWPSSDTVKPSVMVPWNPGSPSDVSPSRETPGKESVLATAK